MDVLERNAVAVTGPDGARPMLFAHGFGCDQAMWRFVAPAFADDHRLVRFDHVGAGSSDLTAYDRDRYATLAGYADDVVQIVERLDLSDVVLVAHSVSCMIAALATAQAPDRFGALVMIGPSPRYVDDGEYRGGFSREDIHGLLEAMDHNYLGWSEQMAQLVAGSEGPPEVEEELTNSFCRTDPEIARHFARTTFLGDNRQDLAEVPVPTLVVQVAADAIAPVEVGEFVHDQLPDSELVVLDTVGHCPHMTDPDATVAAIRGFLSDRGDRDR